MFMDSSTLPTQTDMNNTAITLDNKEEYSDIESESGTKTIDPNAIILAEALTDKAIGWQIHNCKIIKKTVMQDLPLPFLYHYDSLDDAVKQSHPLTPELLLQFNTPMSAREAAQLIGIDEELLTSPWHVKIMGSLVVFSEALQLAVRLHWTNTGKKTQQIYTKDAADAIIAAFEDWQFFGRVDVLYKNNKQTLISIDEQNPNTQELPAESLLTIDASSDYQQLLATHALAVIMKLEADKAELPWFEKAILARLE
ncbi:hypothetical protein GCM10007915_01310 [Psychrobacter pacificensis]|uniref:Uncharacterized protein n=2 Tax=Psychrobacter pacificensis TaxID=112002 RepID=A0ABQ5YTS0_9GAMM|nr:hypothetical protein GCM10007915_01310 [Psychrobacter pacificensis]